MPYSGENPYFSRKSFAYNSISAHTGLVPFKTDSRMNLRRIFAKISRRRRMSARVLLASSLFASALFFCLLSANAFAADLDWSVRTWQIDDGSNNSVVDIAQSPDGYLWIATLTGLNRFDGLQIEHYPVA